MKKKFVETVGQPGDGGLHLARIHPESPIKAPEGIGGAPR